jgi:hypothetical protein
MFEERQAVCSRKASFTTAGHGSRVGAAGSYATRGFTLDGPQQRGLSAPA